jgi:fermentation-respiration switch protein FrsA (DUF1100 family)
MDAASRSQWNTTLRWACALFVIALALPPAPARAAEDTRHTVSIRGREQVLHLYGTAGHTPAIVASGDGGWIHLGPHVAELLSATGFFVVGFDARAYLESFTHGTTTLQAENVPDDFKAVIDFASAGSVRKPVLIGVSEGAGLSVLAATDARIQSSIAGVVALGLADQVELGWRWKDMVIYLTHGTPHEPTFSVKAVVDRMASTPLAAIHSTHDEYAPLPDVRQVIERARQPKRLWTVDAANHRFSDNLAVFDRTLLEAIAWTASVRSGVAK